MPRIADRITSSARKNWGVYSRAARLANHGELIHMELGQPVQHTPQHIKAAGRFAAEKTRASL
jgi:aspartate aminotransferase